MAERSDFEVASDLKAFLNAIERMEDDVMARTATRGRGVEAEMRGFFQAIRQAHKHADRAGRQMPELQPLFGSK